MHSCKHSWKISYQMILQTLDAALQKAPTIEPTGEARHLHLALHTVRMRRLHGQRALGQYVVQEGLLIEDDELLPARQKCNDGRIGLVGHHPHELLGKGWLGWFGDLLVVVVCLLGLLGQDGSRGAAVLGRDEELCEGELGGWTGGSHLLLSDWERRSLLGYSLLAEKAVRCRYRGRRGRGRFAGGLRLLGLAGLVGVLALHLQVVERTGGLEKRHEVRSIGNFGGLHGTGVRLGGDLQHCLRVT